MSTDRAERTLLHKDSVVLFLDTLSQHRGIGTESLQRTLKRSSHYSGNAWLLLTEFMENSGLCIYDPPNDCWELSVNLSEISSMDGFVKSPEFFSSFFGFLANKHPIELIFNSEAVVIRANNPHIDRRFVPYALLPVIHWLKGLDFFEYPETDGLLKIRPDYHKVFKTEILVHAEIQVGLTIEEFEKIQKAKTINGNLAEEFVLKYESEKYADSQKRRKIRRVSLIDVGAGYDIESFQSNDSLDVDKYIEVKSYTSSLRFYMSANELKKATEFGERYFIYLVDVRKINDIGYEPIQITNPSKTIFENDEWEQSTETYLLRKKNTKSI